MAKNELHRIAWIEVRQMTDAGRQPSGQDRDRRARKVVWRWITSHAPTTFRSAELSEEESEAVP